MDLVNQTLAPATIFVSQADAKNRVGYLALKATFETDGAGSVRLVDDEQLPVFDAPEPTALGDIPPDVVLRRSPGLDVVLLGCAHAPRGVPAASVLVALTFDDVRRELLVTGDRVWVGDADAAHISPPVPFVRMPLTWDRAFGGGGEVWLDEHTRIPVEHPGNPEGLGFDLSGQATRTASAWGCPEGFPRYERERRLPNLEDPRRVIQSWSDDPLPCSWGLLPPPVAALLRLRECLDRGDAEESAHRDASKSADHASHPDLRFPTPRPGSLISLDGCRAEGSWWFQWPPLQPRVDYIVGPRTGSFDLDPVQLVLLPEENKFTITYRYQFRLGEYDETSERSLRVRLE